MRTKNTIKIISFLFSLLLILPATSFAQEEEDEDGFTFGGAMRYNIVSESYESDPTTTNTYATWDTWRLNVDGSVADVDLSFGYRFYPTFNTHFIHHGFLGYGLSDNVYMELGVTQVPFGITTYASHSWWFQGPYYVGLEDDYDMGINFDITPSENLKLSLAYFRQAEPQGPAGGGLNGAGRYSYDVISGTGYYLDDNDNLQPMQASLRELNQFNARLAYNLNEDWEIGASAQFGQLYNSTNDDADWTSALAAHVVGNFGDFNLKAEYVNYNYTAQSDEFVDPSSGETVTRDLDIVSMGAYGYPYSVAAKANMYVAGLSYNIPVEWGPISSVTTYLDFTMIDKVEENFEDTYHLIPGFMLTAGSIYTYFDFALGKNQPWLTENFGTGLGQGRTWSNDPADQGKYFYIDDSSDDRIGKPVPIDQVDWNLRFNINIGYYF